MKPIEHFAGYHTLHETRIALENKMESELMFRIVNEFDLKIGRKIRNPIMLRILINETN